MTKLSISQAPGYSLWQNMRPLVGRLFWWGILGLSLAVFVAGLNEWYPRLLDTCYSSQQTCQQQMRLTQVEVEALSQAGWSIEAYARYMLLTRIFLKIVGVALGIILFIRQPVSRMSVVASLFMVLGLETSVAEALSITRPGWTFWTEILEYLGAVTWILFLILFPNGRFTPSWTRWTAGFWMVITIFPTFFPETRLNLFQGPMLVSVVIVYGLIGSILFAQIRRYRKHSTLVERMQSKWVMWSLMVSMLIFLAAIGQVIGRDAEAGRISGSWILYDLAFQQFSLLTPLVITAAILRHHLWDIDLVIRKTLVYTVLTTFLGLTYLGTVTLLQALVASTSGQSSPVVIVLSTLAIAALANPLRSRIQGWIDRRFYRSKYNAEQALAVFADLARRENNLEALRGQVLKVVEQTVQPEQASLWLVRRSARPLQGTEAAR